LLNNISILLIALPFFKNSLFPIVSKIFRLYYISPAEAKTTINELFTSTGEAGFSPIQITEEITTRSIIVRGKSEDLDVVNKIIDLYNDKIPKETQIQ